MLGRRIHAFEDWTILEAGDYGFWNRGGHWVAKAPNGEPANLASHKVTEHEDGTITVSPSIAISTTRPDGQGGMKIIQTYHGYLERGVWRNA